MRLLFFTRFGEFRTFQNVSIENNWEVVTDECNELFLIGTLLRYSRKRSYTDKFARKQKMGLQLFTGLGEFRTSQKG